MLEFLIKLPEMLAKHLESLSEEGRKLFFGPKGYYARLLENNKVQIGRLVETEEFDRRGYRVCNLEDAVLVDKPDWVNDVSDFGIQDSEHYIKVYLEAFDKRGGYTAIDIFNRDKAEMNLVIGYNILEERN